MANKGTVRGGAEKTRMPSVSPPIFWYIALTLILLWIWQDAFRQVVLRTIAYSEFKNRLAKGEISDITIEQDEINGKVTPKSAESKAATADKKSVTAPFLFRSVRIEDPKLVEDLQKAGVQFSGVRPGVLTHFLWAWLLPIAAFVAFVVPSARRIGSAGESVLGFGKSRAGSSPRNRRA